MKNEQSDDKDNFSNMNTKYKTGNNTSSTNRKRYKNNFTNLMNNIYNMLYPQNLYYQYLSINNPNTAKIPVPVPFPLFISKPRSNKPFSINNNFYYFSNPKIKSSFLKQIKNDIGKSESQDKSDNISSKMDDSQSNLEIKKEIKNVFDNFKDSPVDNSKINTNKINSKINESQESKEKYCDINKKEINTPNTIEKEIEFKEKNNNNASGNSSKETKKKPDSISSIKSNDKNSFKLLSNMDQKKNSLERLNNFLQNNKPISNFNNPVKNLATDEVDMHSKTFKSLHPIPFPMLSHNPMQFPFKFPKYNNSPYMTNFPFQNGFNKNVLNFDKLSLNTRNNIKFQTYSSRDYYYKYVCNYYVQIENDDNFFVTKRIIGKNGCFLKKIIQEACIKYGDFSTKIRLRGKGSGYLEHNGKESVDPLMLCVSSLNYRTYYNCCSLIEGLLRKVYNDYYEYTLKLVHEDLRHSMNKKQIQKYEFVVNRFGYGVNNSSGNKENSINNIKSTSDRNNNKTEEKIQK